MAKRRSLGGKILISMIVLVTAMLILAALLFSITMKNITDLQQEASKDLSDTTGNMSSDQMAQQAKDQMLEMAVEKAATADGIFNDFKRAVSIVAETAESIYSDPEAYAERDVLPPDPSKDGQLSVQVLYSGAADPEDPDIVKERLLLGNVQDVLIAVNENNTDLASIYVAAESGITVMADYISGKKYDEAGNIMPLEAAERPWYSGAASTGKAYITPVTRDVHTPRLAIMCGVPVYADGKLRAANAGHEYPFIRHPGGKYELYKDPHGFVVGGFDGETYDEYEIDLEPGTRLFLYTDGLPEAKAPGQVTNMFGLERLGAALNDAPDAGLKATLKHMKDAVGEFVSGEEQFDDLTMLCFEYRGMGDAEV